MEKDMKFTTAGDYMIDSYIVKLVEDENGDLVLPLPDAICEQLNLNIGDLLNFDNLGDGTLVLTKVDGYV